MRNRLKIVLAGLSVLVLASCSKELPQTRPDGEVQFRIVPTVVEAAAGDIVAMSRAKVDGVNGKFPVNSVMGLGIAAPSASPAIASFYNNFYAIYGGDTWRYYLDNVNAGSVLSGFSSWKTIALYGYYPYDPLATDLSAVPFSIATLNGAEVEGSEITAMTDYMVAGTKTKDMETPLPAGELSLEFGHMMTAIDLFINRRTIGSISQPILKLGSVTFEISGGREFAISGTYNAINPDMTNIQNNINATATATKMTITYPSSTAITYTSGVVPARLLIIMPELRYNSSKPEYDDDATVRMTFSFVDQDGSPYLLEDIPGGKPWIEFSLSDITNDGTDDLGLLAGYSYGVQAFIGTYTHFVAPTTGTPTPPHVNYTSLEDADDDDDGNADKIIIEI